MKTECEDNNTCPCVVCELKRWLKRQELPDWLDDQRAWDQSKKEINLKNGGYTW